MEEIAIEMIKVYCCLLIFLVGDIGWKLLLYLER